MKIYAVRYTPSAQSDIVDTVSYISRSLANPSAAKRLLASLKVGTRQIAEFPESAPLCNDGALSDLGIRALRVETYILLYQVNQGQGEIRAIRFLHSTRDYANMLISED